MVCFSNRQQKNSMYVWACVCVVSGVERMVQASQLSVYVRRWRPSQYTVGPFEEIILDDNQSIHALKCKVSVHSLTRLPANTDQCTALRITFQK